MKFNFGNERRGAKTREDVNSDSNILSECMPEKITDADYLEGLLGLVYSAWVAVSILCTVDIHILYIKLLLILLFFKYFILNGYAFILICFYNFKIVYVLFEEV